MCINFPPDRLKEENWNLETTLQELRAQLSDSQASTQRSASDRRKLTNILAAALEGADQTKTENEELSDAFDECEWLLITEPASNGENSHQN